MGRTIASITNRLEDKFQKWEEYKRMLRSDKRFELEELKDKVMNERNAILESNEPDLSTPILLTMILDLKTQIERLKNEVEYLRLNNGRETKRRDSIKMKGEEQRKNTDRKRETPVESLNLVKPKEERTEILLNL